MTPKERARLRGLANGIDTVLQIGKDGIGDTLIHQADITLETRELIKGRVLDACMDYTPRTAAEALAAATNSEVVQVIGSKFVLYRKRKDAPKANRPESVRKPERAGKRGNHARKAEPFKHDARRPHDGDARRNSRNGDTLGQPKPRSGGASGQSSPRNGNAHGQRNPRNGNAFGQRSPRNGDAHGQRNPRNGNAFGQRSPRSGGAPGQRTARNGNAHGQRNPRNGHAPDRKTRK